MRESQPGLGRHPIKANQRRAGAAELLSAITTALKPAASDGQVALRPYSISGPLRRAAADIAGLRFTTHPPRHPAS